MDMRIAFIKLNSFLLVLLVAFQVSFADTYRMQWDASNTCNQAAGRATTFDVIYNTDTKIMRWVVDFERKNGILPNGFQFAVNGTGANPKGHAGEMAFFYYDASNFSDPKLTVYAYNGVFTPPSWQDGSKASGPHAPDKILSSVADNSFVLDFIAEVTGPDTVRLGFEIDATMIQNHSPLYIPAGEIWQGAQFPFPADPINNPNVFPNPAYLGMWFHPLSGIVSSYGTDGYLTGWSYTRVGWCDTYNNRAYLQDPVCGQLMLDPQGSIKDTIVVKEGQTASAMVTAFDYQGDQLIVNYSGLPTGATVSPAAGQNAFDPNNVCRDVPVLSGQDGFIGNLVQPICLPQFKASFEWIPQTGQSGDYAISAIFMDPIKATKACTFNVKVLPNDAPVCNAGGSAGAYQNLSCSATTTSTQLDASGSNDPDNSPSPLTYQWTTDCPNGSFDDDTNVMPNLTLDSETAAGLPVSCNVFLTVSDGLASSSCEAAVSVAGCTKDCEGTINGTKVFDVCGVCDGDGKSCLDCNGVPFGPDKFDNCGECGGNNSTCCDTVNREDQLRILDNNAKQQEDLILQATRRLSRASNSRATRRFVESAREEARILQLENWIITWQFPVDVLSCDNSVSGCNIQDFTSNLEAYKSKARRMSNLFRASMRKLKRARGGFLGKRHLKLLKKGRRFFRNEVLVRADEVDVTQTTCS